MHILTNNQLVHDNIETSLIENEDTNSKCLEVSFITISNDLIFNLSKVLQEYQINIPKFIDGKYVKSYFKDDKLELSLATHKLINGFNDNEVLIVPKNTENQGFFERFFNVFS